MTTSDSSHPAPATLAARGGQPPEFVTRPSAPPVYMTTAFDLEGLEQLDAVAAGQAKGYIYTRDGNPNHEAFASDVAQLERAEAGAVCASDQEITSCESGPSLHLGPKRPQMGLSVAFLTRPNS